MHPARLLGLLAIGAAIAVAVAHRQALAAAGDLELGADSGETTTDAGAPASEASAWDSLDIWGMTSAAIESRTVSNAIADDAGGNVSAFLAMLSRSEGTDRGRDPYRVCYGYKHTIASLADHPAVTGEWKGESIAQLGPQYAGMVSTAAGRYQLIRPTWLNCKRALGLRDFSAASQDAAAVYLIKGRGALDDVQSGRIEAAIGKCRKEWASLPGAGYGQPERSMALLLDSYTAAGGALA